MTLSVKVANARTLHEVVTHVSRATIHWRGRRGYEFPNEILKLRDRTGLKFDVGSITQCGGIAALAARIGWDRLTLEEPDPPAEYLAYDAGMADVCSPKFYRKMLALPKIDTHWHSNKWKIGFEPKTKLVDLSAGIRRYNIRMAITSSIAALDGDLHSGNNETANLCYRDNRFFGLCVVNPLMVAASLTQVNKFKHLMVGLKTIQDDFPGELKHPGYRAILQAAPPDWPIMAHLGGLKEMAEEFPARTFVAAHSVWNWGPLVDLPNVYFDIATSARGHDIAGLIKAAPDRVMFSSDAPLVSPAFTMGKLAALELDDDTLTGIMSRNALRAFPRLNKKIGLLMGQ